MGRDVNQSHAIFWRPLSRQGRDFVGNLRSTAKAITPEQREGGRAWYQQAQAHNRQQAAKYGMDERKSAGILAALSGGTAWDSNKTKHERVLAAHQRGEPFPYDTKLVHHAKAKAIMEGQDPDEAFATSPKIGQFFRGIVGDTDALTLDRWAFRTTTRGERDRLRGKERDEAAAAWLQVSKEENMKPAEFQAAAWLHEKEKTGETRGKAAASNPMFKQMIAKRRGEEQEMEL